jgi:17beta-estradiol 17-dehydrogenase / very-long-chain 3-oxoacyl-CoA reductase
MNLVLVGRNQEKLSQIAEEIKAKSPKIETQTVVIDFSGDLIEGVSRLEKVIQGLDVGLLVNSAGISYPYARCVPPFKDFCFLRIGRMVSATILRDLMALRL